MSEYTKVSALPWVGRAMTANGYLESHKIIYDAGGEEVARIDYMAMPTGSAGIKNSDANLPLIVRACNNHDALLAALEAFVKAGTSGSELPDRNSYRTDSLGKCFEQARAAIAAAKGEGGE